jgi:hypothetical protein
MRRTLNHIHELANAYIAPPHFDGLISATNYRAPRLASGHPLPSGKASRRTYRDAIEFAGLVLLAVVLGTATTVLTSVALRAWIGAC